MSSNQIALGVFCVLVVMAILFRSSAETSVEPDRDIRQANYGCNDIFPGGTENATARLQIALERHAERTNLARLARISVRCVTRN